MQPSDGLCGKVLGRGGVILSQYESVVSCLHTGRVHHESGYCGAGVRSAVCAGIWWYSDPLHGCEATQDIKTPRKPRKAKPQRAAKQKSSIVPVESLSDIIETSLSDCSVVEESPRGATSERTASIDSYESTSGESSDESSAEADDSTRAHMGTMFATQQDPEAVAAAVAALPAGVLQDAGFNRPSTKQLRQIHSMTAMVTSQAEESTKQKLPGEIQQETIAAFRTERDLAKRKGSAAVERIDEGGDGDDENEDEDEGEDPKHLRMVRWPLARAMAITHLKINHPVLGIHYRFDPALSRSKRPLILVCVIAVAMFINSLLFDLRKIAKSALNVQALVDVLIVTVCTTIICTVQASKTPPHSTLTRTHLRSTPERGTVDHSVTSLSRVLSSIHNSQSKPCYGTHRGLEWCCSCQFECCS